MSPSERGARRLPVHRWSTTGVGATAIAIVVLAAAMIVEADRFTSRSPPLVRTSYAKWNGDYAHWRSFIDWVVGDTTEPGYAHSALAGVLMVLGGCAAHWAFRRGKTWMGFPVASGTGLFVWVTASAALGLALSNLAWGWTIARTGTWQPTFVPFASVPSCSYTALEYRWR